MTSGPPVMWVASTLAEPSVLEISQVSGKAPMLLLPMSPPTTSSPTSPQPPTSAWTLENRHVITAPAACKLCNLGQVTSSHFASVSLSKNCV